MSHLTQPLFHPNVSRDNLSLSDILCYEEMIEIGR